MSKTKTMNIVSFKALGAIQNATPSFASAVKQDGGSSNLAQRFLDRFAVGLSVLCAVHCLALPILLVLSPSVFATVQIDDHAFHQLLVWLAIPTSAIAVFLGCKRHKDMAVFAMAGTGIAALTVTAFLGHDVLGETGEKVATLFAVSVITYAHLRNFSLCREESCRH